MPQATTSLDHIILAYRKIIHDRYDFASLSSEFILPDSFDEERVHQFRDYFLEFIYPNLEKRAELNEAFESLDSLIKQPQKLLNILMASGRLIFKFGRQLPKLLSAGIKALQSFRAANRFEMRLAELAEEAELEAPYSTPQVDDLVRQLSPKEIDDFIESSQALFETMHDHQLVQNIETLILTLVNKMKAKPKLFSAVEVRGLEIGYEIIHEGFSLLTQIPQADQAVIIDSVIEIERATLKEIFESKN